MLDIPHETLCDHILPYLEIDDILHFICSTKYHYQTFLLSSSNIRCDHDCETKKVDQENNEMNNVTCTSRDNRNDDFSNHFWKELCVARWKSFAIDSSYSYSSLGLHGDNATSATTTTTKVSSFTNRIMSQWYCEYKRKHLLDAEVRSKVDILATLEEEIESMGIVHKTRKDDSKKRKKMTLWSSLVQEKGPQIMDGLIIMAKKFHKSKEDNSEDVVAVTNSQHEVRKGLIVHELIEGIHRFQISLDFQRLLVLEKAANEGQINNSDELDEDCTSLEYGAILINKFYQDSQEIIADYDILHSKENASISLEMYVKRELDGMARLVQNRLQKRLECEQRLHSGNLTMENQWPTQWVLEEMKILFNPPPPRTQTETDGEGNTREQTHEEQLDELMRYPASIPVDLRPFQGNEEDYYSYHNSLLDKVIKSRKGIPITLSVVYAAIAKRVSNIDLVAVGLPGHFMLSTTITENILHDSERSQVFVDVFHGATILTKDQCQHLICSRYSIAWDDSFIDPVPNSEVWCRMLRNLMNCHNHYIMSTTQEHLNAPPAASTSAMDYMKRMMDAARVLISIGFQLSRELLRSVKEHEKFIEAVAMLSMTTLNQKRKLP